MKYDLKVEKKGKTEVVTQVEKTPAKSSSSKPKKTSSSSKKGASRKVSNDSYAS